MHVFSSSRQAIFYFLNHNPARQKHLRLESEGGHGPETIGGREKDWLWALVLGALRKALKHECREARLAYNLCELGRPGGVMLNVRDAAHRLHRSRQTVWRWIDRITDNFERELVRRHLLDPNTLHLKRY